MVYSAQNFEALKITLEQAAKIVSSSNVTKEERIANENVFIEFRKSKSPYDFCRFILETCQEPYVLFQTISTLREATLREWTLLTPNLIIELQNFLLNYVINNVYHSKSNQLHADKSDKYVQRQILQTLAVFYKRSKLDSIKSNSDSSLKSANMVKDVIDLFKTSNINLKQICCSLLLALLNEFSNTSRSTKLGLSSDSHFTAKRSFEQTEFKQLLVFLYETTHDLMENLVHNNINSIRELDQDSKEMLMQLFSLIDQSFNWEFTSSKHILKNLMVNFNQTNSSSNVTYTSCILEPTPEFKEFFLNPNLVTLLFKCYELVRDDQDMAHASMQTIIQLSTLNGPIFKDDDSSSNSLNSNLNGISKNRADFVANYLESFLTLYSKIQIKDYESFNIACLIENLMSPANIKKFKEINYQLIEAFFNIICSFLINCFKAEKACNDNLEGNKYLESYEKVLIAWTSIKDIINDDIPNDKPNNLELSENIDNQNQMITGDKLFKNYSQTILDAFVQSRLSSYNFSLDKETINLNDDRVECDSIDEDDSAEDDLHRYKEILYSIGEFAKYSLDYCLPMLSKLLNEKYYELIEILSRIAISTQQPNNLNDLNILNKHLTSLNEDIHWILLISGFILFEINNDIEQQTIPKELMAYSIACSKYVDLNLLRSLFSTLSTSIPFNFSSSSHAVNSISNTLSTSLIETRMSDIENCDPIIRLIFNSFQICELEIKMFHLNMLQNLSPQVATTLMWFLREFSRGYLFMKEENYTDLSPTLHVLFGQETECGIWTLNFLLRKLYTNFYIWSAENTTTSQTAKLLLEIVKHKEMCKLLLQNEQFWSISKIAVINEMPWILLPSSVKKIIIKSLIVSCSSQNASSIMSSNTENSGMQMHFYSTILKPLSDRFDALGHIKAEYLHNETNIKELMSLVETLNGIIEGASKSLMKQLLPFVLPRIQQGVHLLDIYHNYGEIVELILCMFNGIIEKFLPYISDWPDAKNQIYHSFLCLIQVFSRHNSGKRSNEANIEEDYYNDLLLFITLLNTLHNIESDNQESHFLNGQNKTLSEDQLTYSDIILTGLEFLIPLMNQEMFKFQSLCIEYFKLISHTTYSNSSKLFSRSFQLFSVLLNSIEFGINSGSGTEISRLALDCIIPLCNHLYITKAQQSDHGFCLRNLFKVVFHLIFQNSFDMELFEVCSGVLYSFICCFQDTYSLLVGELLTQYEDENLKQKILEGFNSLTPQNFNFNMEKRNRLKFNTKFNDFCVKIYGLLFIR